MLWAKLMKSYTAEDNAALGLCFLWAGQAQAKGKTCCSQSYHQPCQDSFYKLCLWWSYEQHPWSLSEEGELVPSFLGDSSGSHGPTVPPASGKDLPPAYLCTEAAQKSVGRRKMVLEAAKNCGNKSVMSEHNHCLREFELLLSRDCRNGHRDLQFVTVLTVFQASGFQPWLLI
ncbi:uncharacterized protein ACIQIH_007797 [Cyanocitta cristata]